MIRRLYHTLLGTLAVVLLAHTPALAEVAPSVRYETAPQGSRVTVEGTSNIHDWDGTTDRIDGWILVPGQWADRDGVQRLEPAFDAEDAAPRIEVRIPVTSLEGNRRGLASNMHDAMKASDHPHVTFTLSELRETEARGAAGATWTARGELSVAGTRQAIDLVLRLTPQRNDTLRIEVQRKMKMTEFGIDPPRALMGMARAADDVDVDITWVVRRQTPQPTPPAIEAPSAQREAMTTLIKSYDAARRALAEGEVNRAHQALGDIDGAMGTLRALEDVSIPENLREQWQQRLDRLEFAVRNVIEAAGLNAARASFAVLSPAVAQVLELARHDHPVTVLAHQEPTRRGVAGAMWLELGDKSPTPPRSPYVSEPSSASAPIILALYPSVASSKSDSGDER